MASIQIIKYEFLQNNPFGTYAAGDIIDVFVETDDIVVPAFISSDGITAFLNDVEFVSPSAVLIDLSPSIVSITEYNPQICSSTYLVVFGTYTIGYYGQYYSLANHPSCVVNPSVCDLMVVGVPSVIGATGTDQTDGSITVTASSSNTIEYRLNEDFEYGDGNGQSSGTFSGLLPGQYRIYLRDSLNCAANVLVDVPVDNSYGEIYRGDYDDQLGYVTRLSISKRSYSGSVTEVCEDGSPFSISLRGEGVINKFEPILATQAQINLLSRTDFQFIEIYTNDPRLYKLTFQKNFGLGFTTLWTGWILPSQYQEEYKNPPYIVNVKASDGLPELKKFYLEQPNGQRYFGKVSLIKLISYCLNFLNLELDIRVACNIYAVTKTFSPGVAMNTAISDDPFDQAYIDYEAFYLANNNNPSIDYVLRSILKAFGCQIILWENVWNIVRVEEKSASYDYRTFDPDGDYLSNSSFNPIKSLGTDVICVNNSQFLEIVPGYGNIRLTYKLGLKPNIVDNGDFRLNLTYSPSLNSYIPSLNKDGWLLVNGGYTINESFEEILGENQNVINNIAYVIESNESIIGDTDGGTAYIQSDTYNVSMGADNKLKITFKVKVPSSSFSVGGIAYLVNTPYVRVRLRVKYGSQYLLNDGNWSSTENILSFFLNEFDKYVTFEITANQPTSGTPTAGQDFELRLYHAYAFYTETQSLTALRAVVTYSGGSKTLQDGHKIELRDVFTSPFYIYYYELEENTDAESIYDIVRPDDYHATNNPRQWILKTKINQFVVGSNHKFAMAVDFIKVQFLVGGQDPFDAIVRTSTGESGNRELFEEEVILGSYSSIVTTERRFNIGSFNLTGTSSSGFSLVTKSILSADLIYTGWLRASNDDPYEYWTRDGVAESDKLHGILLRQYAFNYKQSWRLLRGDFRVKESYFGFLNVLKETYDNNRIYMPISVTLNDFTGIGNFEFLEMVGTADGEDTGGSTGGGDAPYSSGFTTGFGSSGFN